VVRISKGTQRTEFAYHSSGQRVVRRDLVNGSLVERTHYIGNVEVFQGTSGGRQFRRMIGGAAIATWFESTGATQVRYLHKDHLGSTTAISNESGQVVTWMSYDPWGQRRAAASWNPWQAPPGGDLAAMLAITPRGYTGHEHVDSMGIIHMNGRIYDPRLARFLQADPFIEDTSTLNRYTYVHNNPLAYTDPSGYFSVGQFLRTVVAVAISVWTGGALSGASWAILNASAWTTAAKVALVAASGAVSGAIQSGTIEGAAWGAFSAAVFFGIGEGLANAGSWAEGNFLGTDLSGPGFAVKTVSHGLAGGTLSRLQGGKFGHGFVSAAGSAASAPFADLSSAKGAWTGAAVSSVIGGTLSKLSGGKFANGAVTAAMSYAFNQLAHSARQNEPPPEEMTPLSTKELQAAVIGNHDSRLAFQLPSAPQWLVDGATGFGDGVFNAILTRQSNMCYDAS
jgi:RHS repeat-associated protein